MNKVNSIKIHKPTSPGRRNSSSIDYKKVLTPLTKKSRPNKSLLTKLKNNSGRNNTGTITVRHQGGRQKRQYRIIDFKRDKDNILGKVASIEYDPNRTTFIALINYVDGEKRYILAPKGLKVGFGIMSGKTADIKIGNCKELGDLPEGTFVHNVEINPKQGGIFIKSAGSYGQISGKDETGKYILIKLPSGEMRKVLITCRATIGQLSNTDHINERIGKAGRNRLKGIRPTVRGSVMNPIDHPHGGGEGKAPIGRKTPMTPWGKKARGVHTRKKTKQSSKYIVRTRRDK